jgi:hypothetical protein
MFIYGFGGSWFDHPFWRTRFVLASAEDLEKVQASAVPYVIIDEARGRKLEDPPAPASVAPTPSSSAGAPVRCRRVPLPPPDRSQTLMQTITRQRRRQVQRMVGEARQTMRGLFDDARMGRAVRVADTHKLVEDIADAVANSPRTVIDVVRLKSKDEYTFAHSVAVCTLMINVATFLGLDPQETRDYGQAGLLHDLGKVGIPQEVLNKPAALTQEEFACVRDHPEHGYRLLEASGDVCATALDVCRHHHERQDGRGYPQGLAASQISRAAAFGAICDCYDALTSDRIYKQAWSPPEALAAMWAGKDISTATCCSSSCRASACSRQAWSCGCAAIAWPWCSRAVAMTPARTSPRSFPRGRGNACLRKTCCWMTPTRSTASSAMPAHKSGACRTGIGCVAGCGAVRRGAAA